MSNPGSSGKGFRRSPSPVYSDLTARTPSDFYSVQPNSGFSTEQINVIVDQKLSSFKNLLGEALMERRESQKKISELEKIIKIIKEEKSDLKHQVENQSLNISHLESEASRVQKENEERLRVLEEKNKSLGSGGNDFEVHEKSDPPKEKSGKLQMRKDWLGKTDSKHNNLTEEADQHANHLQTMSTRKSVNVKTVPRSDDIHSLKSKLQALDADSKMLEVKE